MNLREDIHRIREVMGLQEQNESGNINAAYSKIIEAVKGFGTNPDKIIEAIGMLKNKADFFKLEKLFEDNKTGYTTFEDMVNEEYDRYNYEDASKLTKALEKIGVYSTFNSTVNKLGAKFFAGKFQIEFSNAVDVNCQTNYTRVLPHVVKYWKDWLSNPITKEKIRKNWDIKPTMTSGMMVADNRFEVIYKEYFKILDNIELVFYTNRDNIKKSSKAFVISSEYNKIYINCSQTHESPSSTLSHEVQHLLWEVKPMNSKKSIGDVFRGKENISSTNNDDNEMRISQLEKTLGVREGSLISIYREAIFNGRKEYYCDKNENMSQIMGIRKLLNIKPNQKITFESLKPYIEGSKNNTNITYLLYCWAWNNFPDINQMINRMNDLALNQSKGQQTQINVA